MTHHEQLESLFGEHGFSDLRWIDPTEIAVAEWVRMKCAYGCSSYGRKAACPPNLPSVADCRQFFHEYAVAAVFHFARRVDETEDRLPWTREVNRGLMQLERDVFLSGHFKAFLLLMAPCSLCDTCVPARAECKHPKLARPTPEGMAVDVFTTVRKLGYPIEVLSDYAQTMNRYAFLLVE
ncbi:MAG: DUF2284 domain-containing protein [Anaerolineae bacterium]|jgi:predicted metal-binding protein|nr:DUF2284 domain-containing protein [Anaerolineae bacterium]